MRFINVGFGNLVSVGRIISVVSPGAAPIKRIISEAKVNNTAIDATCGRKTKSVIIMDTDHVILSSLQAETIANRIKHDEEN
ncbi:MAG: DUF370 domain-containing protein [Clostridia bacterium]|nr:DUF370 domain-containing protein [Clostridia bacterium]